MKDEILKAYQELSQEFLASDELAQRIATMTSPSDIEALLTERTRAFERAFAARVLDISRGQDIKVEYPLSSDH